MYKKFIFFMILFFTSIVIGAPNESFAAEKGSAVESAAYVFKLGTNLMAVGGNWFLKSNYNWSSKANDYTSSLIHPTVGMFVGLIVGILEFIINLLVFYLEALILVLIGLFITIFGAILFPVVFIFSGIGSLFSPG